MNLGWVVLARKGSIPVAGAVFFHSGKTAYYKFGASDETQQHLRGNNLVMWHAIQWLAQHNFETLDFGRTSLNNAGLRRFKLSWGTREGAIDYVKYDLRMRRFVTARDTSTGLQNHLFRRMPVSFLRFAGRLLYRHIA